MSQESPTEIENLSQIDDPKLVGTWVRVKAVIASNSIAYTVPTEITVTCTDDEHKHKSRKVKLFDNILVEFVETSAGKQSKILKNFAEIANFDKECKPTVEPTKSTTLKKLRIRPVVSSLQSDDGKFFDSEGNEWKSYDVYVLQNTVKMLEPGKEVLITGKIIPDPRSQRITMIISNVSVDDTETYILDNIKSLKQIFDGKNISEIMNWITDEFEKYSRIVKRRNVAECAFLTFFSPLHIDFEGKKIPSWIKSAIVGDSTTGKSEITKMIIKLLKTGQIISGESASIAGLDGATTQSSNNQWFIDYGMLVLQDGKLLAIDGAHKLSADKWAVLAESERNGKVVITKAAKGEALARTRQIRIMNPLDADSRTTRTVSSFLHPVQSIQNNLQIQSIARVDLASFVIDDVSADDRNRRLDTNPDDCLYRLSDLVRLVWQQKYRIIFQANAVDEILKQATYLETKFKHEAIPLVTNDQKFKLAKLAASCAAITCSFNKNFHNLIIKKEHVEYVANIIDVEYSNAGLDKLAKTSRIQVDENMIEDVVADIFDVLNRKAKPNAKQLCDDILLWISAQTQFTIDELQAEFELTRDNETRPLFTVLKKHDCIKNIRSGFAPTKKGIALGKHLYNTSSKNGVSDNMGAKDANASGSSFDAYLGDGQ